MNTPLAWKNLTHNKVRTAVALAGVGFAVILIFMQMGFKDAIKKTATQIYSALDFDLMLRSPAYIHLTDARSFPRTRIHQAASLAGVTQARPFYLGLSEWQKPQTAGISHTDWEGQWRGIITMGVDPNDPPFVRSDIRAKASLLTNPRFVLIDRKSKPEYGPANGVKFGDQDINVETSLGPWRIRIIDHFELGTGLASNGACLTSTAGYVQACPWQPIDQATFGLITLRDSQELEKVKLRLQQMFANLTSLPANSSASQQQRSNVEVLTRGEVNIREERRWVVETPLGQIFNMGVWVALIVGVAIVYQVLSADIANMIGEYATLKAMGYSNKYLMQVILGQSFLLAVLGFIPSMLISWVLYIVVGTESGMPMTMTWQIATTVLALAIVMCVLSGLAALRKLYQADPADLF
ncbi:MAG: FtsX-like permease family protein [Pirellulales bacterium]